MSLINDALRRANQQKNAPTPEPSDGAPMQPVQNSPRAKVSVFGPMLLIFFLGVVLTCAGWFFWKSFSTKPQPIAVSTTPANSTVTISPQTAVAMSPAPQATAPVKPSEIIPPVAAIEPGTPVVTSNAPASNSVIAQVTPPAPPPPAALKLQGIFYRISNPTALINGKTVGVGEKVENARVINIERQAVTLERDGQKVVLELR